MKNKTIKTIGIFGHYGNLNLGDEAIITALIENIHQRFDEVKLFCFSINPAETESRYGITTFPIRPLPPENDDPKHAAVEPATAKVHDDEQEPTQGGMKQNILNMVKKIPGLSAGIRYARFVPRFFAELPEDWRFSTTSYKSLKKIDLLIIAGSNQFLDNFGGPWGFPFTLLRWSILARFTRTKVSYVSVGAGPLDARLSKKFCRAALSFADYASFRDTASQKMIVSGAHKDRTSVYPDLAFSLLNKKSARSTTHSKPVVGINVMAMYDPRYWCEPDADRYNAYIDNLAIFAASLIRSDYDIFFFGTQKKDEAVLVDVIESLNLKIGKTLSTTDIARYSSTVYELLDVIDEADVVIATRFHGTVLSLFSNKPTLGVCYYRKSADLLTDMGQGDYYVYLDDFEPTVLLEKFKHLMEHKSRQVKILQQANQDYKQKLFQQYDILFHGLLKNSRTQPLELNRTSTGKRRNITSDALIETEQGLVK